MAYNTTDFKGHNLTLLKALIMQKINSIEELKKEATYNEKNIDEFFVMLNGGLRSSKRVTYFPETNTYDVLNEIDDSYQEDLTEEQLRIETHIIYAIENGAFFKYNI